MTKRNNDQSMIERVLNKATFLWVTFGFLFIIISASCDPDRDSQIEANFSFSYISDNLVEFVNESTGDYYSATWDFGNGSSETTTDKKEVFEVYYPSAGDYDVTLKILDYSGNTAIESKTLNISKNDLTLSFTAEIDPEHPNYVNLTNTTEGTYDSFIWIYRNLKVEDEMNYEAYFPKAGSYNIELQVSKSGNVSSLEKTVVISQNDPDYIEGMTLVWSDEFDETTVNSSNWTFETGANGWGNSELQNYTASGNTEILDGKLIITAKKVNDDNTVGSYTSARIISKGKQEFQYGRIEIMAKLPSGTGIWPAIWMLGGNISSVGWPACGEIDIMEYVGYDPNVIHSTVHTPAGYAGNGDGSSKILSSCEEEFHIYGLIWDEQGMVFYTDTPENITHTYAPAVKTVENWPFDQTAFFILNVAVGGNWGGVEGVDPSIFPQAMEIDFVRVYQESK